MDEGVFSMQVGRLCQANPATLSPAATVMQAVETMAREAVGAVLIVENEELVGLFSERDVMLKVVLKKLDPATTPLGSVMSTRLITVNTETDEDEALKLMVEHHIRHLPVTSTAGRVAGILSVRNLLQQRIDHLTQQVDSLYAYMGADGPGG